MSPLKTQQKGLRTWGIKMDKKEKQDIEEKQEKLAHKWEDIEQTMTEHLYGTARLAESFASIFGKGAYGRMSGLLHDIGKYSDEYQHRIRNPKTTPKCDHTAAGALEAMAYQQILVAMSIMGHHRGLYNVGGCHIPEESTFYGRLVKGKNKMIPDYSSWKQECGSWDFSFLPGSEAGQDPFKTYLETKMLFSALVDADYLDTERSCINGSLKNKYSDTNSGLHPKGKNRQRVGEDLKLLLERLDIYIEEKQYLSHTEGINGMRSEILAAAADKGAEFGRGIYTFTVPTGGGKTISSLRFALCHGVCHGLDRIIYVIPYTNIIEQTAAVFRSILGNENVLEHHSQMDWEETEEDDLISRQKLASENWDANIIVTTAVQFFESLFHNKTSKCRKLHNIANSVVIYDEAQMIPVKHWIPCVRMIKELSDNYRVTQVLCTATQPAMEFQDLVQPVRELALRKEQYFKQFRRVTFRYTGEMLLDEVAERVGREKSVLCIVNTKKTAKMIFDSLNGEEGIYHLSTMMVPAHREKVLGEIRTRLEEIKNVNTADIDDEENLRDSRGENRKVTLACKVIATSLVEAGVDLDFPCVLRELAGLDSILQAAGRCNRNGTRRQEESITEIFSLGKKAHPSIAQQISAAEYVMKNFQEWDSLEAIEEYFIMWRKLRGERYLDSAKIMDKISSYSFQTVAENFHLIDNDTLTVYVPWEQEGKDLTDQLRSQGPGKELMRKLGRYGVNIFRDHFADFLKRGDIVMVNGAALLNNLELYHSKTGLSFSGIEGEAFFI